jgi:hypothetical protein
MATSAFQVAEEDYRSLNSFQKEVLHRWPVGDEDAIDSHFQHDFTPSSWYSSALILMSKSSEGSGKFVFNVDKTFHNLHYIVCHQNLPAIEVKPNFADSEKIGAIQIAWTHNICGNITERAQFKQDTSVIATLDTTIMEQKYMWYRDMSKERIIDEGLGNVRVLEEWNKKLPYFELSYKQPWPFSKRWNLAYQIFRVPGNSTLAFYYKFRTTIQELMRMRRRVRLGDDDSCWVDITPSVEYITGVPASGELPVPDIMGRYTYMDPKELQSKLCDDIVKIYYDDFVIIDKPNPYKYGETAEIELDGQQIAMGVFYSVYNEKAEKFRNLSNPTTNKANAYKGFSPIARVSFQHGTNTRIEEMSHQVLMRTESESHFPAHPNIEGYGAISIPLETAPNTHRVAINFTAPTKGTLKLKLGNMEPYVRPIESQAQETDPTFLPTEDRFIVRVRVLVLREITYTRDPVKGTYAIKIGPLLTDKKEA